MNVVYDHQAFSTHKYGGVSRYFYELATRISHYHRVNATVLALAYSNQYLRYGSTERVIGFYFPRLPKTDRFRILFNNLIGKALIRNYKPDIVHETYYNKGPLESKRVKTVITIYDMIHELFPENFSNHDNVRELKKKAIQRADRIICISNTTRDDLLKFQKIDPAKLSVVYLAPSLSLDTPATKNPIITVPYILYVGARRGHKNFRNLLRSYATSTKLNTDMRLVCFGGGAFKPDELEEMRTLKLNASKVMNVSGNDSQLVNLYRNARAFVCPSIYEGFGIPPLEAMSLGCPVVCSGTGSLPEVVGEAAEFFNPYDVEHITHSLEKVVYSNARSSNLRKIGFERVNNFSWNKCTSETYEIYSNLLSE